LKDAILGNGDDPSVVKVDSSSDFKGVNKEEKIKELKE